MSLIYSYHQRICAQKFSTPLGEVDDVMAILLYLVLC
jgi:hypothetical protein